MDKLEPFEVIMKDEPHCLVNDKNEVCFQVKKTTELIRCKNCKYHRNIAGICTSRKMPLWGYDAYLVTDEDFFCAYGEKSEVNK